MKTETKAMITVGIVSVLVLVLGSVWYSKTKAPVGNVASDNPALIGEGRNVKKATDEKVVLVEFADFECPACKSIAPYIKDLSEQYKENVTFVFRTFPIHSNSVLATQAAEVVKELTNNPDNFFAYGYLLFEKQSEWETASGAKNQIDLFAGYAKTFGVDEVKFKERLSTNPFADTVEKDRQDAIALGVNSTPNFFVNGTLVRGANYNSLKALIDQELAK